MNLLMHCCIRASVDVLIRSPKKSLPEKEDWQNVIHWAKGGRDGTSCSDVWES